MFIRARPWETALPLHPWFVAIITHVVPLPVVWQISFLPFLFAFFLMPHRLFAFSPILLFVKFLRFPSRAIPPLYSLSRISFEYPRLPTICLALAISRAISAFLCSLSRIAFGYSRLPAICPALAIPIASNPRLSLFIVPNIIRVSSPSRYLSCSCDSHREKSSPFFVHCPEYHSGIFVFPPSVLLS